MAGEGPTIAAVLRPRVRLVGGAAVIGIGCGGLAFLALFVVDDPAFASRKTFAVGALLFGFGLLGWSGSIMAGTGFESMQEHLDVSRGWTERKSRRAMARIGGFGGGWMLGVSVAAAALA